jgi:predicted transcriptional regulator of viral defense system
MSAWIFLGVASRGPNVKVATVERTLIDAVDRADLCGGISDVPEIFRRGRSRAKVDGILEILPTYRSKSLIQRMGFMLEAFGFPLSSEQERRLQELSQGNFAYLFAPGHLGTTAHHSHSNKWRLVINADGFLPQEKVG